MAKFDKQSLCQKYFFSMKLLHAHAQYIFIVCAKYQKASVKALIQIDFPMYALYKRKQNHNLKANTEKNGQVHKALILSKNIFWHQTSSANVQCVYIV